MISDTSLPSAIAVVDDDDSLCEALVGLVRSYGLEAHGFCSAEAFLDSGTLGSTRCVVTDVHMPGMGGFALAQRIRERHPKTPVILITARSDPGIDQRAQASGAICLLRKPFTAAALIACIEKSLGTSR